MNQRSGCAEILRSKLIHGVQLRRDIKRHRSDADGVAPAIVADDADACGVVLKLAERSRLPRVDANSRWQRRSRQPRGNGDAKARYILFPWSASSRCSTLESVSYNCTATSITNHTAAPTFIVFLNGPPRVEDTYGVGTNVITAQTATSVADTHTGGWIR